MKFEDRRGLLYKVAHLYYEKGLKKFQIAARLNQSPTQVGYLLKEAEDVGIVRISVQVPTLPDLQKKIIDRYGLADAKIVPADKNEEFLRQSLGKAAAEYFDKVAVDGKSVAIGGGTTLIQMVDAITEKTRRIEIVPAVIAQRKAEILHIDPYVLCTILLTKCNWQVATAYGAIPIALETELLDDLNVTAKQLEQEKHDLLKNKIIRDLYDKMKAADVFFIGASSLSAPSGFHTTLRNLEERGLDMETLKASQIIGDVNYTFFDKSGSELFKPYLSLDQGFLSSLFSKREKKVILVSGGYGKADIVKIALENRSCNIVITDENTVSKILNL